jgi:hypothetical protein
MEELFLRIMNRIHKEQRLLVIKRRIAVFSVILVGCVIAILPAFNMLKTAFTESGFMQFLSLLFSDFEVMVAYWQQFLPSLLESFPVLNLMAFLTVILGFLESAKYLTKDIKFIYGYR